MEHVVLVDDYNKVLGTAPKDTVHTTDTPLHRGFSLFVFNRDKELLVTRRAYTKKTFPGKWTNTVCGHPQLNETPEAAALRRLKDELGMTAGNIRVVAPYRYKVADIHGILENEICPILVGYANEDPRADTAEVGEWKWMPWREFLTETANLPDEYSPWCIEEAVILQQKDPGLR